MNRRYGHHMRVNAGPVRSPLARFLFGACAVALGIAAVWLALFVVLPILGVTVSIIIGAVLAVIGGVIALLFAVPWVIALLAAVGLLKWLFGR